MLRHVKNMYFFINAILTVGISMQTCEKRILNSSCSTQRRYLQLIDTKKTFIAKTRLNMILPGFSFHHSQMESLPIAVVYHTKS